MKNRLLLTLALCIVAPLSIEASNWYVSNSGSNTNTGAYDAPFKTISKAAELAIAGDSIIVSGGVYRERVSPANRGISPTRRITYMAAEGEEVYIKGSEVVKAWRRVSGNIWRAVVDNKLFGEFNPYATNIYGDWLVAGGDKSLGEIYINNRALLENPDVTDPKSLESGRWYSEVNDDTTTLYANFPDSMNPTKELVEINVRSTCFFPRTTGIDYITVDGFHLSQAATQWSPPTGEQTGIIGPNWSKGWIIRNCDISNSRCVGICLGKERASGHNMWSLYKGKFGYMKGGFNREIEAIFKAYDLGWNRENVGSHLIENNTISECGQAGIVGHLGSIFSTIRHNEIRDICYRGDFTGHETGGIKLHAAIDVVIEDNLIYHTCRGIWLDWQAQGTHLRRNIVAKSAGQDLFVEVSHGPTFVYNNLFLSRMSLHIDAQGVALFNNVFWGFCRSGDSQVRYTPYHEPHSTRIKGLFNNGGGDIRFYNNLFLANGEGNSPGANGLAKFSYLPVYSDDLSADLNKEAEYLLVKFPVWSGGNIYGKGGEPYDKEVEPTILENKDFCATLSPNGDGSYTLDHNIELEQLREVKGLKIDSEMLGQTIISEAIFENPDMSQFLLKDDLFGNPRNPDSPLPGAFERLDSNVVWRK